MNFNNDSISKLKTILKKFMNYKYWFTALKQLQAAGNFNDSIAIIDYLVSLQVMDADKTLLLYSMVVYGHSVHAAE